MTGTVAQPTVRKKRKKQSLILETLKRLMERPTAVVGLVIVVIMVLAAIFAPFIAPYDPNEMDTSAVLATPSAKHIMGCDTVGRDQFSRLIYGARYSLGLGLTAAGLGAVLGIILGVSAGYFGGWVDIIIMRLLDVLQAIPGMLLSICISTALGSGFFNTVIALSIGGISGSARMLRAKILSERQSEYLEAAHSINCKNRRIMFKHLLPNVISPVIVSLSMGIGGTITQASGLSYIGLGVQPPTAEWGAMLSLGRSYFRSYPHLIIYPGLFIAVTVLAMNLLGDGLRDALDPKLKR